MPPFKRIECIGVMLNNVDLQGRRKFIKTVAFIAPGILGFIPRGFDQDKKTWVMTVNGPIEPASMGNTLIHEHILVDFMGADTINSDRWDHDEVIKKVLPFLDEARVAGCRTFIDCTPNFLGRDVKLLYKLSALSGLNIVTNTGYYGGSDNKFLPANAFTETADVLAERWIDEWQNGIDLTGIKPGFIKISVNPDHLSDISKKLVQAAALTHLKTGLTIASHTGPAIPAFEQIEIFKNNGVHPEAFIWVHAQNEKDWSHYKEAAKDGAWISLDGLSENNISEYVAVLSYLKKEKCLDKVLVSHDAGWYEPGKANGGDFRVFTTFFKKLIPALEQQEFEENEIKQLLQVNPQKAFSIRQRNLRK